MRSFFSKHFRVLVGVGLIVLFFAYGALALLTPGIWNAPDERAVATFSEGLAQEAPYAASLGGLVRPRSVAVVNGNYVPESWLGMPWLVGGMKSALGGSLLLAELAVVLISVIAMLAWGDIVRRLSGSTSLGVLAATLFATFPGFWYYTARGFHPNALFLSMLMFGLWCWLRRRDDHDRWLFWSLMTGALLGVALMTRLSEAVWLLPLAAYGLWREKPQWKSIVWAMVGLGIPIMFMLGLNQRLYGSFVSTGYNLVVDPAPVSVSVPAEVDPTVSLLFPFGIHERNTLQNVWEYQILLFFPWALVALVGLSYWFRKGEPKKWWPVLIPLAYLFVVYGSWNISDTPAAHVVSIGLSYVRYWLPVSLLMTLLAAYGAKSLAERWRIPTAAFIIVGILSGFGAWQTIWSKPDGLLHVHRNLIEGREERAWLIEETGEEDIIITEHSDKFIFPYRQVIVPLRSPSTYASLPAVVDELEKREAELWYFGVTLPMQDIVFLKETELEPRGLTIDYIDTRGVQSLYRIYR